MSSQLIPSTLEELYTTKELHRPIVIKLESSVDRARTGMQSSAHAPDLDSSVIPLVPQKYSASSSLQELVRRDDSSRTTTGRMLTIRPNEPYNPTWTRPALFTSDVQTIRRKTSAPFAHDQPTQAVSENKNQSQWKPTEGMDLHPQQQTTTDNSPDTTSFTSRTSDNSPDKSTGSDSKDGADSTDHSRVTSASSTPSSSSTTSDNSVDGVSDSSDRGDNSADPTTATEPKSDSAESPGDSVLDNTLDRNDTSSNDKSDGSNSTDVDNDFNGNASVGDHSPDVFNTTDNSPDTTPASGVSKSSTTDNSPDTTPASGVGKSSTTDNSPDTTPASGVGKSSTTDNSPDTTSSTSRTSDNSPDKSTGSDSKDGADSTDHSRVTSASSPPSSSSTTSDNSVDGVSDSSDRGDNSAEPTSATEPKSDSAESPGDSVLDNTLDRNDTSSNDKSDGSYSTDVDNDFNGNASVGDYSPDVLNASDVDGGRDVTLVDSLAEFSFDNLSLPLNDSDANSNFSVASSNSNYSRSSLSSSSLSSESSSSSLSSASSVGGPSSPLMSSALIGGVVGSLLVFVALVLVFIFYVQKRRKSARRHGDAIEDLWFQDEVAVNPVAKVVHNIDAPSRINHLNDLNAMESRIESVV